MNQIQGFSQRKKTSRALFSSGFVQIGWLDPAESWFEVEILKNGQKWTRKKVCLFRTSWGVLRAQGAKLRADPLNIFYATFGIISFLPGRKNDYPIPPHFFGFRVKFSSFFTFFSKSRIIQGLSQKLPAIEKSTKNYAECQSPFIDWFSIPVSTVFFRFSGQFFF